VLVVAGENGGRGHGRSPFNGVWMWCGQQPDRVVMPFLCVGRAG
jgi:hypothetical protein